MLTPQSVKRSGGLNCWLIFHQLSGLFIVNGRFSRWFDRKLTGGFRFYGYHPRRCQLVGKVEFCLTSLILLTAKPTVLSDSFQANFDHNVETMYFQMSNCYALVCDFVIGTVLFISINGLVNFCIFKKS